MVDSDKRLHPTKPLRCMEEILAKKAETYRNRHNVKFLAVSSMGAIGEHGAGVFAQVASMFLEASKDPTAGERRAWLIGTAKAITVTGLQREWVWIFMDWAVEKQVRRARNLYPEIPAASFILLDLFTYWTILFGPISCKKAASWPSF